MTYGDGQDLSDMSMLDLFRMEAENHCATLSDDLLALEQEPAAADLLESLMRAAHSVKGAARVVELHIAVQVAHAMEDVFVAAQNGKITLDQDDIDMLLKGVDTLSNIAQLPENEIEGWLTDHKDEIESFANELMARAKGGKKAKPETGAERPKRTEPEKAETAPPPVDSMPFGDLSDMSMMDLFRMEAENHCAALSDDLLALEQEPAAADLLESLMRAAHSVKGAARIVELHIAVQVAHAMEDVFVAAQAGKISLAQDDIDLLLKGVDTLSSIAKLPIDEIETWLTAHKDELEAFAGELNCRSKGTKSAKPAKTEETAAKAEPVKKPARPAPPETPPSEPSQSLSDLSDMSMLDLFRMEAENHCATLSDDLLALEQNPTAADLLESLMRAAHSVKGAARVVGLHIAVQVAHAMEDVFVAAQNGKITLDQDDIDILLQGVDLLNNIAQLPGDEIENWLTAQRNKIDTFANELMARAKGEKLSSPKKEESRERPAEAEPAAEPEAPPLKEPVQRVPVKAAPVLETKIEPKHPTRRADDKEGARAIRVSADNMNRLMGLAGEVLIESRWLPSFSQELLRLKKQQDSLLRILDKVHDESWNEPVSELVENLLKDLHKKIDTCRSLLTEKMTTLEDHARHATEISYRLYHEVIASRMRPFSEGIKGFPRMVRDLSKELDKKIKLEIIGPETPVDRDILEKIEAPLNHLIRNSIDHGIETPAERLQAGKSEEATLRLEARHSSGMLNIIVGDDGRGIDLEKLRKTIVDKKLVSSDMARDLSDSELLEFLFLPNFSTKKSVSKVSGRGVGLDVVHSVVHEVRGVVRTSTKMHKGTTFELQLPLTLSVMRALLTEIDNEPYAFPLVAIDHVLKLPKKDIKVVEGRQYFTMKDKRIGLVTAQQVFNKQNTNPYEGDDLSVVVFSDRFNQYGLSIDRFWGVRDLVVQTLDPRLGKIKDISSGALLEDGTPVLIIDVEDTVRSMDSLISGDRLQIGRKTEKTSKQYKRILVADDSITVREVERKMLTAKGYEVDVAIDGMDAWNNVHGGNYDLVITDIDMPRMNGIELVSLIKNDPNLYAIPVIIVSYKDRKEDRERGLDAGADYYLTKGSFQDEKLVNAVLDLIGEAEV